MTKSAGDNVQDVAPTDKVMPSLRELAASWNGAGMAFFNTTQGVLTGRPGDEDLRRVREELDSQHIAYLFNPDGTRPRPMFSAQGWDSFGLDEIRQHIAVISGDD